MIWKRYEGARDFIGLRNEIQLYIFMALLMDSFTWLSSWRFLACTMHLALLASYMLNCNL